MGDFLETVKNWLILLVILLILGGLMYLIFNKSSNSEYTYVARGIQCKEYDKNTNTLKGCDDAIFGKVEIINPVSVLKVRLEDIE